MSETQQQKKKKTNKRQRKFRGYRRTDRSKAPKFLGVVGGSSRILVAPQLTSGASATDPATRAASLSLLTAEAGKLKAVKGNRRAHDFAAPVVDAAGVASCRCLVCRRSLIALPSGVVTGSARTAPCE